ncbi:MAG: 7TM domain-containing protein [Candidatus Shapirobacteria bacterium]|nr:7TM domain-containing protein [Candidatus Shapirobacteria bacterium]MDD4410205.1 7TM domain-containing protein [Candidatus Shapirobacteria bacterium]
MKKIVAPLLIVFGVLYLLLGTRPIEAKAVKILPTKTATPTATLIPTAIPTITNITEAKSNKIDYKVGKWNGLNSMRWMIRLAIERGVSTNTIVLLLLLPLIATLVSFLHYVVGLSGYGIFMPTMIAVAFLATGFFGGLLLFALILIISLVGDFILKKLKIHFWPARAINLMFISVAVFGLMLLTSFVDLIDISSISIFPILFMILLAEEFVRTQLVKSKSEAKNLMIGTIVLAISGGVLMNFSSVQNLVLRYPELVILVVLVANLLIGNYSGIRLTEIKRFKGAIRSKPTTR